MNLILAVNLQNTYFSKNGGYFLKNSDIIRIRILDYLSSTNDPIIFIITKRAPDDNFFISEKTHSIATSSDCNIYPDFIKYVKNTVYTVTYNPFFNTNLDSLLKTYYLNINNIQLIGVETHTSILFTAEELRNRGYNVSVIEPCTTARDIFFHDWALTLMKNFLSVSIKV